LLIKREKLNATLPPPISGISRSTSLNILGVTITSSLSVADHIHTIVTSCSQTLHALRVLRSQGLPAEGLFEVFRGVIIAKLLYAASAWWGFTSANDKQRLAAFIRRSIRQGFCAPDFANFSDIIDHADDDLFKQILSNPNHVLAPLLPVKAESHYSLRSRPHDRQLIPKLTKLYDSNFIVRMLYKQVY